MPKPTTATSAAATQPTAAGTRGETLGDRVGRSARVRARRRSTRSSRARASARCGAGRGCTARLRHITSAKPSTTPGIIPSAHAPALSATRRRSAPRLMIHMIANSRPTPVSDTRPSIRAACRSPRKDARDERGGGGAQERAAIHEDPQRGEHEDLQRDLGVAVARERDHRQQERESSRARPARPTHCARAARPRRRNASSATPAEDRRRREHQPVTTDQLRLREQRGQQVRELKAEHRVWGSRTPRRSRTAGRGVLANGPHRGLEAQVPVHGRASGRCSCRRRRRG